MVPFLKPKKQPEEIPVKNNRQSKISARPFVRLAAISALLLLAAGVTMADSLLLKEQGSFFVGGRSVFTDALTGSTTGFLGNGINTGNITVDQMYVQYQIPETADSHLPVVMVHGCCLSSKSYETTPDGRMGWNEYFLRNHRAVYLPDQVSRARSGFDATIYNEIKLGKRPASDMPEIRTATHELAWLLFRFGPTMGKAFSDEQFPVEAFEEFGKQVIPDLNAQLPTPNPTWTNLSLLAIKLKGAILMGHSESGFFPEQTALINPTDIKGLITIETGCPALNSDQSSKLNSEQISKLAKIPTLVVFGDHIEDVPSYPKMWKGRFDSCAEFVNQINAAGGDATMMHLPKYGQFGNSHMLMQDKNSNQVADLILKWIDEHVESKKKTQ
jgi:pimeloyl-ACP methyl ester carboxylesterase